MADTYAVRNWTKYQHYKDRNPPWIKLHFQILSSEDWVTLDDSSRVLAIACMLIASRNEGKIDASPKGIRYIERVAYLNQAPDLNPLIECGFLVPLADASAMLAFDTQETETEEETETERETRARENLPAPRGQFLTTLPADVVEALGDDPPTIDTLNGPSVRQLRMIAGKCTAHRVSLRYVCDALGVGTVSAIHVDQILEWFKGRDSGGSREHQVFAENHRVAQRAMRRYANASADSGTDSDG